jgi:nucleoside 2-deoxyribosyltransferase
MIECKFGIAVLEGTLAEDFNPNVALEYGFMLALGKPTLLLKEQRMSARADIPGTAWESFDILDIENRITEGNPKVGPGQGDQKPTGFRRVNDPSI